MAPIPPPTTLTTLLNRATTNLHSLALHATRTLHPRQTDTTNPSGATVTVISGGDTNDNNQDDADDASTLSGGAIAGIVIGSIAGFLLLLWIIRSCTNLGAPPGEAVPGKPWYGGVRDEYRDPRGRSRGRSRSRSRRRHYYHRHGHGHGGHGHGHHGASRSRSRRVSMMEEVPVQEMPPAAVVVRDDGRRRSRSRGYYAEPPAYGYDYGEAVVRGSRSRSRGRY